jgi:hypothetical protein
MSDDNEWGVVEPEIEATPPPKKRSPRSIKVDWATLKHGECVVFDNQADYLRAVNAARCFGSRNGIKFTSRAGLDGKYRIWRK